MKEALDDGETMHTYTAHPLPQMMAVWYIVLPALEVTPRSQSQQSLTEISRSDVQQLTKRWHQPCCYTERIPGLRIHLATEAAEG